MPNTEAEGQADTSAALRKARELARQFQGKFSPVLAQLNGLLFEANNEGIDVTFEIGQSDGYMSLLVVAKGVATPAGRALAQRRGLIP